MPELIYDAELKGLKERYDKRVTKLDRIILINRIALIVCFMAAFANLVSIFRTCP